MSLFPHPSPPLPAFKTLLVKGNYHPSAPIHLSLSYITGSKSSKTILITPSRQAITQGLHEYNDDWLALNSGCGDVTADDVISYPPSPAHLCLLLSMFRASNPSDVHDGAWINSKTTLSVPPVLLILHEPSTYFIQDAGDDSQSKWTVSSYMSFIVRALSSLTAMSSTGVQPHNIAFALFDSQLDQLKLPIFKQPTYQQHGDQSTRRLELVAPLVQRYFEWMAVVDQERSLVDGDRKRQGMNLYQVDKFPDVSESWQWWEVPAAGSQRGRQFSWTDVPH